MKLIAAIALSFPFSAFSLSNDMILMQRNAFDTGTLTRVTSVPTNGNSAIFLFNGSAVMPQIVEFDSTLNFNGTTIGVNTSVIGAQGPVGPAGPVGPVNTLTVGSVSTGPAAASITGSAPSQVLNLTLPVSSAPAKTFSYLTRALNTCFQPSATRDAIVSYAVDIQTSLSLLAGQQGTVYLESFSNATCTAGAQEITRFVNGQTGALTVGLSLVQNVTGTLTGVIPAGSYLKLRTESNTGTPIFTARPGQEVLL